MRSYFIGLIKRIKFYLIMEEASSKLSCPSFVRGMKVLDRSKFSCQFQLLTLKVDKNIMSSVQKMFIKKYIIKLNNFKPIERISDSLNCVYMDPDKIERYEDLDEEDRRVLESLHIKKENFSYKDVNITYDNWKSEQIFHAVLPKGQETVSGFTQIGHIIHLNLRDHLAEYKKLIGEVLIDKIKTCRTVVNKVNVINNTYRNFQMELLAGDEDFFVTVKENNCSFQFDFSKVYWNSRLHREHERIVKDIIHQGDIIFDVFAGVGPFALPALKRKCIVFANDLNPESYKWLVHNAKFNKLDKSNFNAYNLDGAEFIRTVIKERLLDLYQGKLQLSPNNKVHIIMNLPALAVTFLNHFNGLLKNCIPNHDIEVILHVYCFVYGNDSYEKSAIQSVIENLKVDISESVIEVFTVRNVAPAKEMMRVTFKLTSDILCAGECSEEDTEPPNKKACNDPT